MIELYNDDCLNIMPQKIEDKSVDLILCDLPYQTTNLKWDKMLPFDKLWQQYERIIKDDGNIVLFGCEPFTSLLITSNLSLYKYSWVWIKNRCTGHMLSKVKPMKKTEDICVFSKGSLDSRGKASIISKYFPQNIVPVDGLVRKRNDRLDDTVYGERNTHTTDIQATNYPTNVLYFDIEMNEERYHPTQKPQQLLEYLIKTYTNENDLVLDNCMGSGSTGVACKTLNRDFIGIELDKKYFDIAEQRINNHKIKNDLW